MSYSYLRYSKTSTSSFHEDQLAFAILRHSPCISRLDLAVGSPDNCYLLFFESVEETVNISVNSSNSRFKYTVPAFDRIIRFW